MSIDSRVRQYGSVFGKWKIREYLGGGSGGKTGVFRLVRVHDGWEEVCALKVVNIIDEAGKELDLTEEFRQDYRKHRRDLCRKAEQEVQLMYRLGSCAQVVNYLDYTFSDWQEENRYGCDMLIRMEFLTSLEEVRRRRGYEEKEVLRIGRDIAAALVRCHQEDILHRDIKPANVFVTAQGDYKLGDFGIARILDDSHQAYTSTGTQVYAAPEQYRQETYDHRVDVYSLGLTLYELSNRNRLPFAETSYARDDEIQMRLLGKPLPPPDDASPALAAVILKACAFDPKERYQSAQELLDALNRIGVREAAEECPAQISETDPYATLLAKPDDANTARKRTKKRKPRRRVWPFGVAVLAAAVLLAGWYFLFGPGNGDEIGEYDFCIEDCTWEEAFARAQEKGGQLVRIDSLREWKYLQKEADELGYRDVLFLLGGRRDVNGAGNLWMEYHWADEQNQLVDEALNGEDSWANKIWMEGEPSFSYNEYQEAFLSMQYREAENCWVWNDIVNNELEVAPGMSGRIGYIVEYPEGKPENTADHHYAYHLSDISWSAAMEAAKEEGGYLVNINSQEELDQILADLEELGYRDKRFYLGGRRDPQGSDFFWVNGDNQLVGESISAAGYWAKDIWFAGEPSLTYEAFEETCVSLQYDEKTGCWGWNDVADDILQANSDRQGQIGYIVEFDD